MHAELGPSVINCVCVHAHVHSHVGTQQQLKHPTGCVYELP